jgi:hypothetical protein
VYEGDVTARRVHGTDKEEELSMRRSNESVMVDPEEYSASAREGIRAGLNEIALGSITTTHPAFAFDELRQVWRYGEYSVERTPGFSLSRSEWTLGMTEEFMKAIRGIERTLQGRVLERPATSFRARLRHVETH